MLNALARLLRLEVADQTVQRPGLQHYLREIDGQAVRYHLRIERDGTGLLIANATAVVRLSASGVAIASALLDGRVGRDEVARRLARRFRGVSRARAVEDTARVDALIDELAQPMGRLPFTDLAGDAPDGAAGLALSAPLGADMVLADVGLVQDRLHRLWEATIPQVVLVVQHASQTEGLVELVEHAEDLGLITGVRARASLLEAEGLLAALAQAGLDRVDLPYAAADAATHDGLLGAGDHAAAERLIEHARQLELCPVAMLSLLTPTMDRLHESAARLVELGVGAALTHTLVAAGDRTDDDQQPLESTALRQIATTVEELADVHGLNLAWTAPCEWRDDLSITEQLGAGPRTSGAGWVRIGREGAVLLATGASRPVGRIDGDGWAGEVARIDEQRAAQTGRCECCPGLALCSAGCPARPESWALAPGAADGASLRGGAPRGGSA